MPGNSFLHTLRFCIALAGLLPATQLQAQDTQITGHIHSTAGKPVGNASILFHYNLAGMAKTGFAFSDSTGRFKFLYKTSAADAWLEITALGYHPQKFIAVTTDSTNMRILLAPAVKALEEARIVATPPVRVKGDTTSFNANSFGNKNETSVESLVKKIPGFDVDNDGNIKYNGRPIERVLLDGDDLFGKDFKLLTKNLSADALDKIQVVDNYNANTALAGLGNTDKQVLNLKLKKNTATTTANMTAGGGLPGGRYDNRLNLLTVSAGFKWVVLGAMNNIGSSPFSFVEPEKPVYQPGAAAEQDLVAVRSQPLTDIPGLSYRGINAARSNLNKARLAGTNFLTKPIPELVLKGRAYFIADNINQQQTSITNYITSQPPITIRENSSLQKRQQFQGYHIEAEYRPAPATQLTYRGGVEINRLWHTAQWQLQNNYLQPSLYTSMLNTEHRLQYTRRLRQNKALGIGLLYHYGRLPQTLTINPVQYKNLLGITGNNSHTLVQESALPVQQLLGLTTLTGAKKNTHYTFSLGYRYTQQDFSSALYTQQAGEPYTPVPNPGFAGHYRALSNRLFASALLKQTHRRLTATITATLNYETYRLTNRQPAGQRLLDEQYTWLQQQATLAYKAGKSGRLSLQYTSNNRLPLLTDLLPHYWLSTYRSFEKGVAAFKRVTDNSIGLNYSFADFYKRQLLLFAGIVYNTNPVAYTRNLLPLITYDITNRLILPARNEGWLGYARIEKYIPAFTGNIILDANSYSSSYLNQTAGINVLTRFNISTTRLAFKSVWQGWFNIQWATAARLNNQRSAIAGTKTTVNNHVYEQKLQCYLVPPKSPLNVELGGELYSIPSAGKRRHLFFADFNIQYTIINNKLVTNFLGSNLFNVNTLSYDNITPLQVTSQQFNLLPRYLMLKVYYKF